MKNIYFNTRKTFLLLLFILTSLGLHAEYKIDCNKFYGFDGAGLEHDLITRIKLDYDDLIKCSKSKNLKLQIFDDNKLIETIAIDSQNFNINKEKKEFYVDRVLPFKPDYKLRIIDSNNKVVVDDYLFDSSALGYEGCDPNIERTVLRTFVVITDEKRQEIRNRKEIKLNIPLPAEYTKCQGKFMVAVIDKDTDEFYFNQVYDNSLSHPLKEFKNIQFRATMKADKESSLKNITDDNFKYSKTVFKSNSGRGYTTIINNLCFRVVTDNESCSSPTEAKDAKSKKDANAN